MEPRPAPSPPLTIGWQELVDLPGLGLYGIRAKMDTGALVSALHVDGIERLGRRPDGTQDVRLLFRAAPRPGPERVLRARAVLLREVEIVDSGGHPALRPLVATRVVIGPVHKTIPLLLADRSALRFRMILGRSALEGDFLVQVGAEYLLGGVARGVGTGT